jgi:hypothetical protein
MPAMVASSRNRSWASFALGLLSACSGTGTSRLDPPITTDVTELEGSARGYPSVRSLDGQTLANGEFSQWIEGERVHVKIHYEYPDGRVVEEQDILRQKPSVVQERWSWTETRRGELQRQFDIDFVAGVATAQKREKGELRQWSKKVDLDPGHAFAGSAFTLAIKGLRTRLLDGEKVRLQTVGFTPKPRMGTVELSHDGTEDVAMAGRTLSADRFVLHPLIPWIAKPFVHVPDSYIWLATPPPAAFLRWQGPMGQPSDDVVRVDLLPGDAGAPTSTNGQ